MLYYVETGVEFTNEYGDIDEQFYSSLESVYLQALTLMKKEKILEKFMQRADQIASETKNMGWGFYDSISDIYSEFFPSS